MQIRKLVYMDLLPRGLVAEAIGFDYFTDDPIEKNGDILVCIEGKAMVYIRPHEIEIRVQDHANANEIEQRIRWITMLALLSA